MSDISFKTDTAQKRFQQVLKAMDVLARKDQLAFITTKRVSLASGISDGVLFRLFSSKEAMVQAWLESRGALCRSILHTMPHDSRGLHRLIQSMLSQDAILSFLFCHPMDTPYLRQALEHERLQFREFLRAHIPHLYHQGDALLIDAMTDHLMQSMYRAWNPENPTRQQDKEKLMSTLPWEKESSQHHIFPPQELLQRLALNDSGFVFDPESGRSFTANSVGLYILRFLQNHSNPESILDAIRLDFDVELQDAERDLTEFAAQLRKLLV